MIAQHQCYRQRQNINRGRRSERGQLSRVYLGAMTHLGEQFVMEIDGVLVESLAWLGQ